MLTFFCKRKKRGVYHDQDEIENWRFLYEFDVLYSNIDWISLSYTLFCIFFYCSLAMWYISSIFLKGKQIMELPLLF